MTGFDSLSADILPAAAEKLAARGAVKAQVPGLKADDKASKAFGSHLSRLAQENESRSATSKGGGQRPVTLTAEVRTFAVPSRAFDERNPLTIANAKIFATSRTSEEAENLDEDPKADSTSSLSMQGGDESPVTVAEPRPQMVMHHAAMGFVHPLPAAKDTSSPSTHPDAKERPDSSEPVLSVKSDDLAPGDAAGPRMPTENVDAPDFTAIRSAETADPMQQQSSIRPPVPTKIAVVSQETHFEPVLPSATLHQLANSIGEEMPVVQDPTGVSATVIPHQDGPVRTGPVKTLTLQLDPASLGSVTVKMKLTGNTIEVQIAASRPETAQLLEHDRGALGRLLQASGYETDIAAVQVQSISAASNSDAGQSAANFQGQSGQSSAQGQFNTPNQRAGDERPGAQQNQQERRQLSLPQEDRNGNDPAAKPGTLYL